MNLRAYKSPDSTQRTAIASCFIFLRPRYPRLGRDRIKNQCESEHRADFHEIGSVSCNRSRRAPSDLQEDFLRHGFFAIRRNQR